MTSVFRSSPEARTSPTLVEFLPGKLYYTSVTAAPKSTDDMIYFTIDNHLVYWNYCLDFGPLNIGHVFRFNEILQEHLEHAAKTNAKVCLYSSSNGQRRANAVCLIACWGILFKNMDSTTAYAPFTDLRFPPFHDATDFECSYDLSIKNCLDGLEKGLRNRYINVDTFNADEYQFYEKVENGDMSWVSPKFIAFAGPHNKFSNKNGQITLTPEHYVPYFKKMNVTLVVRLNDKCYDRNRFVSAGIDHLDLYYPDGTNAPMHILKQFIEASERTPGAVAVHCKAGLGRTGTCIGCYMMKHEQFTAREVIGWLRLCRPGSVIGPQQEFMEEVQDFMRSAANFEEKEATTPTRNKSEGNIMTNMKKGAMNLLMPSKIGRPAPNKKLTINPQGDYLVAQKLSNSPPQSPRPLPQLGKKHAVQLNPVAPTRGPVRQGSRLQMFKSTKRSKYDHSHDFDRNPSNSNRNLDRGVSNLSIVDLQSDDGYDIRIAEPVPPAKFTPIVLMDNKQPPLTKELLALKSIQGRIDNVMHAFDESMAKTTSVSYDNNEPLIPLTWKVGEILMATHESLTMASGFNERMFTKDMDEVKIIMSRDSQSVVEDWANESTPAMRKITKLFHETVQLLQDMQNSDNTATTFSTPMSQLSAVQPKADRIVNLSSITEDGSKLVARLQNEKAILMGQLTETSNMYTSIAELLKEREKEIKRLQGLVQTKTDDVTKLKQDLFVKTNEEGKRDDSERSVAHWKEKYMSLYTTTQQLETRERELSKRSSEQSSQIYSMQLREELLQQQLKETQALISATQEEAREKAIEFERRESYNLQGVSHEYEHELNDLREKLKAAKDQLSESQKVHKAALEKQKAEMKKHFDKVLSVGGHGFMEGHMDLNVTENLFKRPSPIQPIPEPKIEAPVPEPPPPQVYIETEEPMEEELDDFDDDNVEEGSDISEEENDDENNAPKRRQSIVAQNIHKTLSGMINRAFEEDSMGAALSAIVPPPNLICDETPRTHQVDEPRVDNRRRSLRGSLSSQDLRPSPRLSLIYHSEATEAFDANMEAIEMAAGDESMSLDLPSDERISILKLNFDKNKAALKRKFIDSMCIFRQQMIDQYDKKASEMTKRHRQEVMRITQVAEERFGKLLEEKDSIMNEAKRTIKTLYKSIQASRGENPIAIDDGGESSAVKKILKSTFALVAARRMSKRILSKRKNELADLCRDIQLHMGPPSRSQGLIQTSRPNTSEFISRPTTSENASPPATPDTCSRPGTSETCSRPGTSETCSRPGTSETCSRPGTSETCSRPGTTEIFSRPNISDNFIQPTTLEAIPLPIEPILPDTTTEAILRSTTPEVDPRPTNFEYNSRPISPRMVAPSPPVVEVMEGTIVVKLPTYKRTDIVSEAAKMETLEDVVEQKPIISNNNYLNDETSEPKIPAVKKSTVEIRLPGPKPPPPERRMYEPRLMEPKKIENTPEAVSSPVIAKPSMRTSGTQFDEADYNPKVPKELPPDDTPRHVSLSNFVLEGARLSDQKDINTIGHQELESVNASQSISSSMLMLPQMVLSHQYAGNAMYTPPPVSKVPTRHTVQQLIENYANTLTSLRENINWNKWQCVLKCLGLKRMEDVLKVEMDTSVNIDHALIRLRRRFTTKRAAFSRAHENLQTQQKKTWSECMDALVCYNTMKEVPTTAPINIRGTSIVSMETPEPGPLPATAPSSSDFIARCKSPNSSSEDVYDPNLTKRALDLANLLPTDISDLTLEERQRYVLELHSFLNAKEEKRQVVTLPPSRGGKLQMIMETQTIKGIPSQSPFMRRKALESLKKSLMHKRQQFVDTRGIPMDQSNALPSSRRHRNRL